MAKYEFKELDAGLLSSTFTNYSAGSSFFGSIIDVFSNMEEYATNPELLTRNHPDLVFSGRITKVINERIIRPTVIVSDKLEFMDKKDFANIIGFNINTFVAYFLQSIKILSEVYGTDVTMVARFMTDRSIHKSAMTIAKKASNMRNMAKALAPGLEDLDNMLLSSLLKENNLLAGIEDNEEDDEEEEAPKRNSYKEDNKKYEIADIDKLKLGDAAIKVVNVDLKITKEVDGEVFEQKLSLPFVIAPVIVFTNMESYLKNVLEADVEDDFESRVLKFRSGEIGLWDLLFAGDLISDYKRNKIKNKNEVTQMVKDKITGNGLAGLVGKDGSFSNYTQLYIFDKSDEYLIEDILGENLLSPDVWQSLALDLFAFDLNVVDTNKEVVINFITDMPTYSVIPFKQLKKSSGNNSDDLMDIVKAMLVNKPPF